MKFPLDINSVTGQKTVINSIPRNKLSTNKCA